MLTKSSIPVLSSDHASLSETLTVLQRRRALKVLASAVAASALPLRSFACVLAPQETAGPYPGDGTNGPNVLTQSGIVRSDIRSSFGAAGSTPAAGAMNTLLLKIVSASSGTCGPVAGLAVYVWHCNADGGYSMYSSGIASENYLRGVQVTDANGEVTFTSIFPACYSGRWPHIHIEVYSSVAAATAGTNAISTTQLAMPQSACDTVYAQTSLYPGSVTNLARTSLTSDMVFGDDRGVYELATVAGNNADGWTTYLEVGVSANATSTASFAISPGISGSWYDAQQSGQGFNVEVLANGQILVYFYTFDASGNNVWLTGVGTVDGATATIPLSTTGGGFFPPNFDPGKITHGDWGALTLTFSDCDTGTAAWTVSGGSASGYTNGSLSITRITTISSLTCAS